MVQKLCTYDHNSTCRAVSDSLILTDLCGAGPCERGYAVSQVSDSMPAAQQYLCRKRPPENWDPTLWEIPLLPLPKKHKTHWDPIQWEFPCNEETHMQ